MGKHPPIRPPGARPEDQFAACARAAGRACGRVLRHFETGPGRGRECGGLAGAENRLCPSPLLSSIATNARKSAHTGAIERLALETKRNRAIGLAVIDRKKCIAWEYGQYCMVCHEFCPYLAIDSTERNGVECPTVKPDMCRGFGACQVNCPALPDKAIVVKGIPQRRRAAAGSLINRRAPGAGAGLFSRRAFSWRRP